MLRICFRCWMLLCIVSKIVDGMGIVFLMISLEKKFFGSLKFKNLLFKCLSV